MIKNEKFNNDVAIVILDQFRKSISLDSVKITTSRMMGKPAKRVLVKLPYALETIVRDLTGIPNVVPSIYTSKSLMKALTNEIVREDGWKIQKIFHPSMENIRKELLTMINTNPGIVYEKIGIASKYKVADKVRLRYIITINRLRELLFSDKYDHLEGDYRLTSKFMLELYRQEKSMFDINYAGSNKEEIRRLKQEVDLGDHPALAIAQAEIDRQLKDMKNPSHNNNLEYTDPDSMEYYGMDDEFIQYDGDDLNTDANVEGIDMGEFNELAMEYLNIVGEQLSIEDYKSGAYQKKFRDALKNDPDANLKALTQVVNETYVTLLDRSTDIHTFPTRESMIELLTSKDSGMDEAFSKEDIIKVINNLFDKIDEVEKTTGYPANEILHDARNNSFEDLVKAEREADDRLMAGLEKSRLEREAQAAAEEARLAKIREENSKPLSSNRDPVTLSPEMEKRMKDSKIVGKFDKGPVDEFYAMQNQGEVTDEVRQAAKEHIAEGKTTQPVIKDKPVIKRQTNEELDEILRQQQIAAKEEMIAKGKAAGAFPVGKPPKQYSPKVYDNANSNKSDSGKTSEPSTEEPVSSIESITSEEGVQETSHIESPIDLSQIPGNPSVEVIASSEVTKETITTDDSVEVITTDKDPSDPAHKSIANNARTSGLPEMDLARKERLANEDRYVSPVELAMDIPPIPDEQSKRLRDVIIEYNSIFDSTITGAQFTYESAVFMLKPEEINMFIYDLEYAIAEAKEKEAMGEENDQAMSVSVKNIALFDVSTIRENYEIAAVLYEEITHKSLSKRAFNRGDFMGPILKVKTEADEQRRLQMQMWPMSFSIEEHNKWGTPGPLKIQPGDENEWLIQDPQ